MILNFAEMELQNLEHFKGGEKAMQANMFSDGMNRILRGQLEPGATIGYHCHETNSEIIFMAKGTGIVLMDDAKETLPEGCCHYCPKGHSHSLRNESGETIEFFAVVPEQ